uniref:Protein phosphatase 1 regulatory subunit 8 n=1 Tax=Myotis myotis TaxID=51298 RepID=A0A7J8A0N5_MYOMY|nr:protein phosphatase 1 regulatory subunit 8 [Myotis myotis]
MAAATNSGSSLPLFDCPTWAGKPPPGLHLDVVKGDKLIEKLIIDEKKYYLFGRNPDLCDFTIDHQSCSRVHAALVYHKHLKRVFLIDLNSKDVDPSVGRFRNMVQTAVVPVKKKRMEGPGSLGLEESGSRRMQNFAFSGGLYGGLPPTHSEAGSQPHGIHGTALIGGLPMPYPNLAPDVDLTPVVPSAVNMNPTPNPAVYIPEAVNEPKKKKYAKEAWPGKKPTPSLLI